MPSHKLLIDKKTKPLVVIVGETASGKSALALALAEKLNGEIIAADSWTVRREVNIGTAKPTPEEQARVPHHLLDVAGPCDDFTAAVFKDLANEAIKDIASRGKLPIMAGGAGLYIDGAIFDYSFLPAGDRTERAKLNGMSAEQLVKLAHARGLGTDHVDERNKRRVIRLIETGGSEPARHDLRPNTLILGIELGREVLKKRVQDRVDAMLSAGLEREVLVLSQKYGWECEALKGIGYAEWREYFDGSANLEKTRERIIRSTLQLAKRQRTWFRRNRSIHWVSKQSEAVEIATTFLNKINS